MNGFDPVVAAAPIDGADIATLSKKSVSSAVSCFFTAPISPPRRSFAGAIFGCCGTYPVPRSIVTLSGVLGGN